MIPAQAVEAAMRAWLERSKAPGSWSLEEEVRAALEAAAPHLTQPRKPKPGEGDYAPSWDDRKRLAEVWQGKAPLPDEGLSERVYEALIEVAAWGYQQRKDEEL